MLVYVVGERRSDSGMKTTTMGVFSNIDHILEKSLNDYIHQKSSRYVTFEEFFYNTVDRIYVGEVDDFNNKMKILNKKKYREVITEFARKNPGKFAKHMLSGEIKTDINFKELDFG